MTSIPETAPEIHTLSNGLTVTLEHLPYLRSVSAGLWIRAGSGNEQPHEAGISHFLEHLVFKGTTTRTAHEIMAAVEDHGGHLNAFTSRDHTCVYAKVMSEHAETGLDVIGDVAQNCIFADLEKERNVVLEEIASAADVPEDHLHDLASLQVWPKHPLGAPIAGTLESVSALTETDVRKYFAAWYRPGNMYLSIAGYIDREAILEKVQALFGDSEDAPIPARPEPPAFQANGMLYERDIAQHHVSFSFPGVKTTDDRRTAMDLLSSVLGGGSTSRLFERIREDEGLAYSIYTYHSACATAGIFGGYAAVAPENLAQTLELLGKELGRIRKEPISAEELATNKEQLKGHLLMGLESTFNRMSIMARSMMAYGRVLSIDELIGRIDRVTVEDIHEASSVFVPENVSLSVLGPATDASLALPL